MKRKGRGGDEAKGVRSDEVRNVGFEDKKRKRRRGKGEREG